MLNKHIDHTHLLYNVNNQRSPYPYAYFYGTRRSACVNQYGLSLVELMIGITLGLMITVSIGYVLISSRSSFLTQDASARMQESGRMALDNITRDLRLAGRVTIIPVTEDRRTEWDDSVLPIEGVNGDEGAPDTLTIRYQLDDIGGDSTGDGIVDCNGDGGVPNLDDDSLVAITGTNTNYYQTVENEYSVSGNSLECDGNGGTSSQPFVDNVEDFQVTYGLDLDGDSAPNRYTGAPANNTEWNQVVSVRICVLIRSDSGATKSAQAYTDCSGNNATPGANDTRLRRTFTSVVNLRNRNRSSE